MLLGLTTAALAVTGLAVVPANAATAAPQHVGVAPHLPAGAVRVADPDANSVLHLDVALSPRDPAALAAFVNSVSTPGNANYHHYLAKGQFASMFGPTKASIDALRNQLTADGLTVGTPSADALTLPVTTTVSGAEHAFGVSIAGYKLANGRTAYANTAAPVLPATVAHTVSGVLGLDDLTALPTPQHTAAKDRKAAPITSAKAHSNAARSNASVKPQSNAPTCPSAQALFPTLTDGQDYWEPGSLSSSAAYNTGNLYWAYGNTGSGVTVGLFELEDFSDLDIAAYENCYGISVPVTRVPVDGGPTAQPDPTKNIGVESALDIEAVAGVAPGSSILVYQGPDATNPNTTLGNVLDTYTRMVSDDTAQVLSTSWGACELDSDPNFMTAESDVFAQAAAQGQTVLAASGDFGSTECAPDVDSTGQPTPNANKLSVSDPAGQPYVTGVGGTTMRLNGSGGVNLSAWNQQANSTENAGATGGGVSNEFSLSGAANYQSGVQGAGYSNACGAASGATCRQSPDVSAVGDLNTGWLFANGQNGSGGQYWGIIGGTSLSAPLWGAITALADASNSCAANGSVGFANPALYRNPAALIDVTTGNNILQGEPVTQYQAGSGYDLTTGLGSPDAPKLVETLCGGNGGTAGSTFVPTGPTRLLDTRNTNTPIAANSTISLQVTGGNGVPDTGVTAAVLNVTATDPTAGSFLTVYPDGTARPLASNLNFDPGETIPNLVTVPVGSDGKVDIYNLNGSVDVVADLFGYYTTGSGSLYTPVTPVRVLDTRPGTGPIGVPTAAPIGQGQSISLQLTGSNGVPSGATAVVLNVTATDPTNGGYLTVYPDGISRPLASNVNFSPGETIPNLVTVPVGSNGKVDIYNFSGNTDVVADLFGYYTTGLSGFKFHPSAPHRMVDTRIGTGVGPGQPAPIGSGQTFAMPIEDTNGPGNAGPFSSAGALVLNVTVTGPTAGGYVTVFPSGVGRPLSSNLNFNAGQTIPNAVVTPVNGNSINFYNFAGNTSLVVDVDGYFAKS